MEESLTDQQSIDIISTKEAGILAGKKKDTIRSWVRKGKITGYRLHPKALLNPHGIRSGIETVPCNGSHPYTP